MCSFIRTVGWRFTGTSRIENTGIRGDAAPSANFFQKILSPILTESGATGSGKTYLACAFGMEACKQYYSVKYVRLPDLLLDLQAAREAGTFKSVLKRYTNPVLLILDEWLLIKLTEPEARDLFELIHKRRKKSSTIFCSQFRESEWYQQLCGGESTLADAIMDRIAYDSYKIDIESADPSKDISMRKIYGMDPAQAQ